MTMHTRRNLLMSGTCLLLSAGFPAFAQMDEIVGEGLRLKTSDFAVDRTAFHTKLRYHGPSPQPPETLPAVPTDLHEISFPSGDITLKAWVGRLQNIKAPTPVVIFLHGGFAFGPDDFDMARPFLDAGFTVVTPILRGENGQPGEFTLFYDEVSDVLSLAEYLLMQSDWVMPDHIYLAGHSVGGTLTMLAGQASKAFRAIASFSGSPDQIAFLEDQADLIPFDATDKVEYEIRSPMAYARSFKSPTRLFFGTKEAFFRKSTQETAALAQKVGLDVQAVAVPGDHFGAVPKEIELAIAFFQANA